MKLTDYYKMERLQEFSSNKTPRFDCVASTQEYPLFEEIAARSRVKRFFCYYNGVPDSFSEHAKQKAERTITNGRHISSVFIPNLDFPLLGHGDVRGTQDALLFVLSPDYKSMELFIARGYKNDQEGYFSFF